MKSAKRVLSVILCFIMVFTMFQGTMFSTSAKVVGPDNKTELIITQDKSEYSWGDTIVFNVDVKNVTDEVLTGIKVTSFARNVLKILQDGDSPVISKLEPGETQTVQVKYVATKLAGIMAIFFPIFWMFNPAARIAYSESNFNYEKKIKVGIINYRIGFEVEYNIPLDKPTKPENPSEADNYYWDNSEEVLAIIQADKSKTIQNESDVIGFLSERGFSDYEITYDTMINGEYIDDTEANKDSSEKHPMYQTYYKSEKGSLWSIFVINGTIIANPVFYNLESDLEAQVLVTESNQLTSYDDEGNQFYVTIPKSSTVLLRTVSRIDAETLNNYVFE